MHMFNCALQELVNRIKDENIFFFGKGTWLKYIEYSDIMQLRDNFCYVVDNNPTEHVYLEEKYLKVYYPEQLKEEDGGVIIVTSSIYMYDMYKQLINMDLPDTFSCCFFPFVQLVSSKTEETELTIESKDERKIPKIIHSFWFSGEKKPELYQKCIDTWPKYLPDYEIREWNTHNYNWHKNRFLEKAIECKAWAFASDYARLDVVNEYGGIYLDMDVEVLKSFDSLLSECAFFGFANNVVIDLAVFGAEKNNKIVGDMLGLYSEIEPPAEKKDFNLYYQPLLIRKELVQNGVIMNGMCQKLCDATIYSSEFFMPKEFILFDDKRTDKSFCVHHNNFGWDDTSEKKQKKRVENKILFDIIRSVEIHD